MFTRVQLLIHMLWPNSPHEHHTLLYYIYYTSFTNDSLRRLRSGFARALFISGRSSKRTAEWLKVPT